jgi:hypothetical protein
MSIAFIIDHTFNDFAFLSGLEDFVWWAGEKNT